MARQIWPPEEIEAIVAGAFTTHHLLWLEAGTLGELTLPAFRSTGVFRAADGREWAVRRTSWWRGQHEMRERGVLLGTAWPRGFFRREIVIRFGAGEYLLQPTGVWSRGWRLTDALERTLLEVRPRGVFRRGAYLTVVVPVDVPLLVFAYYLVHTRWQEDSAAASAASSSAATAAS